MKKLLPWFQIFFLITFILGWAQFGLCWILCELIAEDQRYFWPFMGIPMTFNLMATFFCMVISEEDEEDEEEKRYVEITETSTESKGWNCPV